MTLRPIQRYAIKFMFLLALLAWVLASHERVFS